MTREEYNKIDAENFSNIKRILESPAAYKAGEPERDDDTALKVGLLTHAMILEGKDTRDMFAVKPAGMRFSTKEGKEWQSAQTLPILTEEEYEGIPRMAEAVAQDKDASGLIRICHEREQFITGSIKGVSFKGIMDGFGIDGAKRPMHLDLKSVLSADPFDFEKAIRERHYDLQDEIYSALIALKYNLEYRPPSAWICVEKKRPYEVACYFPTQDMIECGTMKLQACIDRLKSCRESKVWPKAFAGMKAIDPSSYSKQYARKLVQATF